MVDLKDILIRKVGKKMKVKKRIVIVADIVCDEAFDCNELLIAQDIGNDIVIDSPSVYVGRGEDDEWEVFDYVFQSDATLSDEVLQ